MICCNKQGDLTESYSPLFCPTPASMFSPSSLETRVNGIYHLVVILNKEYDKRHEIQLKCFRKVLIGPKDFYRVNDDFNCLIS